MSATEILDQIRRLPENERREVTGQILEEFGDFDDELSPEQIAELDRRAGDALKNPGRGTPIEEVSAEIRRHLSSQELAPGEVDLIDRRLQDHLDNPDDIVSWEEVKARLDAKYDACLTSRKV